MFDFTCPFLSIMSSLICVCAVSSDLSVPIIRGLAVVFVSMLLLSVQPISEKDIIKINK